MNLEELLAMNPANDSDSFNPGVAGDESLLERNLSALSRRSPAEAQRIRAAQERRDICFVESEEGISATIGGIALASKRRPRSEADKLVSAHDPEAFAIAGMLGFGLGYHCEAMLERLGEWGMVVCYEPDVELLRSVLSRIDFTSMFANGRFLLICEPDDAVRCNAAFSGDEVDAGKFGA